MPADPLPLFPLPGLLLYPEAVVPLHIFEPRYCQMMADMVQAGEERMVICALRPGYEPHYFDAPPVFEIGGVGRVLTCNRLDDGRWNIVLQGERRVRVLREPSSGRLYRRVLVMELPEPLIGAARAAELRTQLGAALRGLLGADLRVPDDAEPGYLADVLLLQLPLDLPERHALFALVDPELRVETVLRAFASCRCWEPPPDAPDPRRN
jgi:Lon protease-like protein